MEIAAKTGGVEAAVDRQAVVAIDRERPSKMILEELEQGVLVDRFAGDVIEAARFGKFRQQHLDNPAHLERGEAREDGAPKSLDRPGLAQEPLQKPELARQLTADERGPKRQAMGCVGLAEQFCPAVEILGVGII